MHHIDTYFDDPFLRAGVLNGEDKHFTMREVKVEEVGTDKEKRPIIYFEEHKKGLVLNKTNAKRIVKLYGPDVDAWPGKRITLYASETDFAGETVQCIRVREQAPAKGGAA